MSDENRSLAEALYGPEQSADSSQKWIPPKHIWDTEPEQKPAGIRNSNYEVGKALYPNSLESTMGAEFNNNMDQLRNHFALTAEEAAATRRQHLDWLKDICLDGHAARLHTLLVGRTIQPLTPEEQRDMAANTMQKVRGIYGDSTADRLLSKAKQLIDARPELGKAISAAGIGNHEEFVLAVVERVRDAEIRGQM